MYLCIKQQQVPSAIEGDHYSNWHVDSFAGYKHCGYDTEHKTINSSSEKPSLHC